MHPVTRKTSPMSLPLAISLIGASGHGSKTSGATSTKSSGLIFLSMPLSSLPLKKIRKGTRRDKQHAFAAFVHRWNM